jgi:hypothetical protein
MELNQEMVDFVVEKAHELLRQPRCEELVRKVSLTVENIYTCPQRTGLDAVIIMIERSLPPGVELYQSDGQRVFTVRSDNGGINIGKYSFALVATEDLRML